MTISTPSLRERMWGGSGVPKPGEPEVRNFSKLISELPTEAEWTEMGRLGSDVLLQEVMAIFGFCYFSYVVGLIPI